MKSVTAETQLASDGGATREKLSFERHDAEFLKCRAAVQNDILPIVKLHQAAFPGFFLTSLGPRFLYLLYLGFINVDRGICIVAENDGCVVGLVAGTTDPDLFFGTLRRKKGMSFAFAAVPGLLLHPALVIRKCLGALFYRGERAEIMMGAGLLSSLAVSLDASGKGIGRVLVDAFCEEAKRLGITTVYLTTDALGNDSVNRFYEKCGFHLADTFKRTGNRKMNRWVKPS